MNGSSKQYGPMSQTAVAALIARASGAGLGVSGSNPWFVDAHDHGVKLRIDWDPANQIATVTVTDKYIYVPTSQIWQRIDPLISDSMATYSTGAPSAHDNLHAFISWRLAPRYGMHMTSGPYDIVDDYHRDERIEAAQAYLNELRGARPGDPMYLAETGVLDGATRAAVRNFQFEAGVGPCDGTPTMDTLLALQAEARNKRDILAGSFFAGQSSIQPPPDWDQHGCPQGSWFDPFSGHCRLIAPPPLPPKPQPMPGPPAPMPLPTPGILPGDQPVTSGDFYTGSWFYENPEFFFYEDPQW